MASVLALGVTAVDFVFYTDSFPRGGAKFRADDAAIVTGGCAFNASVAVSRLNGAARIAGRLGDDPLGDMIAAEAAAEGVDTTGLQRSRGGQTSYSSVYVAADGDRQIMNFRGRALTEDTGWIAGLPAFDAALADTRWPEAALAVLDRARALGVPGVLDGEAPIDPRLLASASHLAFSAQGLASLAPDTAPEAAVAAIAAQHGTWACVTDGANGVHFSGLGTSGHVPAFPVDAVDTLGAGDVWHGAFALALAENRSEPEAIVFANATAALKVSRPGGRTAIPTRAEVDTFLKENGHAPDSG